jgi:transcriptional regulator with XRE-family HTH domain
MTLYEKIFVLREKLGLSQSELERNAALSKGTITNWKSRKPNVNSIEKVAQALNCEVGYLLEEQSEKPTYYMDKDAQEMAEFMFTNPEYKVLFDASRKVKKEDIEFVKQMLDRFEEK